jgi:hypothetical protein
LAIFGLVIVRPSRLIGFGLLGIGLLLLIGDWLAKASALLEASKEGGVPAASGAGFKALQDRLPVGLASLVKVGRQGGGFTKASEKFGVIGHRVTGSC